MRSRSLILAAAAFTLSACGSTPSTGGSAKTANQPASPQAATQNGSASTTTPPSSTTPSSATNSSGGTTGGTTGTSGTGETPTSGAKLVSNDEAWTASLSNLNFNWRGVDAVRGNCISLDDPLNEMEGQGSFSQFYPDEKAQTAAAEALPQWTTFQAALAVLPSDCLVPQLGGTPTYNGTQSCTQEATAASQALTQLEQQKAYQTVANNHAGTFLASTMAGWSGTSPDCNPGNPNTPTENPNRPE